MHMQANSCDRREIYLPDPVREGFVGLLALCETVFEMQSRGGLAKLTGNLQRVMEDSARASGTSGRFRMDFRNLDPSTIRALMSVFSYAGLLEEGDKKVLGYKLLSSGKAQKYERLFFRENLAAINRDSPARSDKANADKIERKNMKCGAGLFLFGAAGALLMSRMGLAGSLANVFLIGAGAGLSVVALVAGLACLGGRLTQKASKILEERRKSKLSRHQELVSACRRTMRRLVAEPARSRAALRELGQRPGGAPACQYA